MKKNTMYILGGVALVGVAYYLYTKNKPSQSNTSSNSSMFSNLTGTPVKERVSTCCSGSACPSGYTCQTISFDSGKTFVCRCVAS